MTRRYSPPNVVMIVMDTARASSTSIHGAERDTTPHLRRLANDSLVFERAWSASPWTLPSHASLFTGLPVSQHRVDGDRPVMPADLPLLPALLQEGGFETACFSNNVWISDLFGFDRGFDHLEKTWQLIQSRHDAAALLRTESNADAWGSTRRQRVMRWVTQANPAVNAANLVYAKMFAYRKDAGAGQTNRRIGRWLARRETTRPYFMFVNYMEPHAPYHPQMEHVVALNGNRFDRAELRAAENLSGRSKDFHLGRVEIADQQFEAMRDLYEGSIRYLDARIAELLRMLRDRNELEDTLLIIVGDHGENIGDHGLMAHRFALYNTLIHVPLLMRLPHDLRTYGRVPDNVSLLDVLPTVVEVVNARRPGLLAPMPETPTLLNRPDPGRVVRSEFLNTTFTPEYREQGAAFEGSKWDRKLVAAVREDHKLIVASDGTRELFDIAEDPAELRDISAACPEIVAELLPHAQTATASAMDSAAPVEVEGIIEDRLRELGYI